MFVKKDTAYTTRIGPFLDKTDGVTEETGLTTAAAAIFLSKNGGDYAAKNESTALSHDQDGWYIIIFDATDTNTVGELIVMIQAPATHLPVWKTYYVVEEDTYTWMFAAGSAPDTQVAALATTANLLDKLGAVDEAAAAGDPSTTESVMQYVKQIVNVLVGGDGVVTFPAEAAPGNTVSLAEVIRAIHTDVTGLNGATQAGIVDAVWDEAASGHVTKGTFGVLGDLIQTQGTVETSGSNSSTQVQTDLAEATNDHYDAMTIFFFDGAEAGQSRLVTGYTGSTGVVSWDAALTGTPADGTRFAIVAAGTTADQVWNEILTGATHNVTNSAGRRLRILQESGTYAGGAIFIDTVAGTAGTTNFENGVDILPVKAIADANTIATSLKLSRFMITPGSSITFGATQSNEEFIGDNWTLALNNRDISGSHIIGADVTGTATGTTEFHFEHCEMGDCTIAGAHLDSCDIEGTVTLSAAADYFFMQCNHAGTAIIDFGSTVGTSTVHVHGFSGALTVKNMGGSDVLHFDSAGGKLTLDNTNDGGTVNLNGTFDFSDSSSSMTINKDGLINNILDTTISELGVAVPATTPTVRTGLMLLYMALRNKTVTQTSGTDALEIYNDAGTKITKKLLTDDGSDYTEAKMS